ncbi:hypothetical protein ACRE_049660 [Hapsidospora chrysogenum ATCC 11550]|uniref:Uncharacterized protein n=1 Tax=Hapsidospora chrysogenum (strain ATCC 11550 / CBS 779.69 / DSM 880 / IAM 14645 / JCM 23072 / IMI 49137) TaxID=857340 RepID=A0A086T4C5_HAPC1|nr:hypothetical protein ACRE_049660 [Hapsidospora chrysogenum ATCC 11550]
MAPSMEAPRPNSTMDVEKPQIGDASTQHVDDSAASTPPNMDEVESQPMSRQSMLAFATLCGQFNAYVMSLIVPSGLLQYINAELGPDPNSTWITVTW